MINPHHDASTEANEREEGGDLAMVGPDIEDADLSLGRSGGGIDHGLEIDPLLEEVKVTVARRYCGEQLVGGGEADALAGKGVKRLEDQAAAIPG